MKAGQCKLLVFILVAQRGKEEEDPMAALERAYSLVLCSLSFDCVVLGGLVLVLSCVFCCLVLRCVVCCVVLFCLSLCFVAVSCLGLS